MLALRGAAGRVMLRCVARLSLSAAFLPLVKIREARVRGNERRRRERQKRKEGPKA